MKKVLILGAGVYQVPLIKKAKEMGIYTIVSSIPGTYPGFQFADKIYYENTIDQDAILKIAISENIDGILTTGTDVAVKTIGYVNDQLGLTGVSLKSAQYTTNKAVMKQQFAKHNVRTARFFKVSNPIEAETAAKKIGLPVIFKCVDKSGSRGITRVDTINDVAAAFEYAISYSNCDYIIVEKFLSGYEIGLDGYVNGEKRLLVPHGKLTHFNGLTDVPMGHTFPFDCEQFLYDDILFQANQAIDALCLDKCFFNMDIIICENQSYIIEVGGRTGATCIPELMGLHYNCDFYEMMIQNALGEDVSFNDSPYIASAGTLLYSDKAGKIKEISVPTDVFEECNEIIFDYDIGEFVNAFKVGPDRIGHLIVTGKTVKQALQKLSDAKAKINIEIDGE